MDAEQIWARIPLCYLEVPALDPSDTVAVAAADASRACEIIEGLLRVSRRRR